MACHQHMPCPSTLITMIDLPTIKRLEWFGQPAIYLLQWLATIHWTGALVAMMRNHTIPRGAVVQLSRTSTTSTNLDQPVLPHKCMHIDTARTIYRHSFAQRFSQILSEMRLL